MINPVKEEDSDDGSGFLGRPPSSSSPKSSSGAEGSPMFMQQSPGASPLTAASMLFQPFLPAAAAAAVAAQQQQQNQQHRPLPFSIDNILKPTFGHGLLLHSMAAAAAAHHAAAAAAAAAATSPYIKQEPPSIPVLPPLPLPRPIPAAIQRPVPVPATRNIPVKSPSTSQVDLTSSSKKEESTGTNGDLDSENKEDGDCPPGMVRGPNGQLWPAWVFCTRYSDRPSSGPRLRKVKKPEKTPYEKAAAAASNKDKRPRTAFSSDQLARLKKEFDDNRYLNEERRKSLADELGLNENQIKIWFQNKRAKLKKGAGTKGELAQMLAAQGLYNHSTVPIDEDEYPNLC